MKKFFKAVFNEIKTAAISVKKAFAAFFSFLSNRIKAFYIKILKPGAKFFFKLAKSAFRYIIFLPFRYLAIALKKTFYYIIYVPLRFTFTKIRDFIIKPVLQSGKFFILKTLIITDILFKTFVVPVVSLIYNLIIKNIFRLFRFILVKLLLFIKLILIYTEKLFYVIIRPFYIVFREILRFLRFIIIKAASGVSFVFGKIAVGIKFVLSKVGKFLKFLIKKYVWLIEKISAYVGKFFYHIIIWPLYVVFRSIFRFVRFITGKIADGIKFVLIRTGRFLKYLFIKFIWPIKLILIYIAMLFYNFLFYPLYITLKAIFRFFKFAILKIAKFIYKFILKPLYRMLKAVIKFFRFLIEKIAKGIRLILVQIGKFFKQIFMFFARYIKFIFQKFAVVLMQFMKFLYQSALIILFLPLITVFCLALTLFTVPYTLFKTVFTSFKKDISAFKVLLYPAFAAIQYLKIQNEKLEKLKLIKKDTAGIYKVRNYCGMVMTFIWSLILYPVGILVLTIKG